MVKDTINRLIRELPATVKLVAVSKFHPFDAIEEAYEAGQRIFAESRPQELLSKVRRLEELRAERGEDYISVALLNCFLDCVLAPTVTLDREYSKIEFSGASGRIEGNKVIFDTDIPAFDFVVFKAYNH